MKAAGGCSAPALKQTADAIPLGAMRFGNSPIRTIPLREPEAELMIRHPNTPGCRWTSSPAFTFPLIS